MTTNHDLIEICKKLRFDLTAAQGKLTDVIQALENGAQIRAEPADPAEQILRQIDNGVIRDRIDLAAELAAHPVLTDAHRLALEAALERKGAV